MSVNRDKIVLERRFFPEGTIIIKEGDEGDAAFLIQSGQIEVYKTIEENHHLSLAYLDSGEIFGEMTLLFEHNRTASAKAVTDCNLIVINRQTLTQKLAKSDPTIRAMMTALVRRLDVSTRKLADTETPMSVVEMGEAFFTRAAEELPEQNKEFFIRDADSVMKKLIWLIGKYNQTDINFE